MNKFDEKFFQKYLIEWEKLLLVIHKHIIVILDKYLMWIIFWFLIPSFLYYYSLTFQQIPFYLLEIWFIFVFIKIIYDIFDWYNDVWIITETWIIALDRKLFNTDVVSVKFENIEWMQVEQYWFVDTLLKKWDLVVHKIWEDSFYLQDVANPFWILDEIWEVRKKEEEEILGYENWELHDNRFNILVKALNWIVWEYLNKKWINWNTDLENLDYEKKLSKEYIEKIKSEEGTLDLREEKFEKN